MIGKSLCDSHGGKTERVSCLENVTHGMARRYLSIEEAEQIAARAATLETTDGIKGMLRASAARIDVQSDKITDAEHLPQLLAARHSVRSDLSLLHDIQSDETSTPQLPVFVVSSGPSAVTRYRGRTVEGSVDIVEIEGTPWILDASGTVMQRAVKQIDEESSAEWYAIETPLLADGQQ